MCYHHQLLLSGKGRTGSPASQVTWPYEAAWMHHFASLPWVYSRGTFSYKLWTVFTESGLDCIQIFSFHTYRTFVPVRHILTYWNYSIWFRWGVEPAGGGLIWNNNEYYKYLDVCLLMSTKEWQATYRRGEKSVKQLHFADTPTRWLCSTAALQTLWMTVCKCGFRDSSQVDMPELLLTSWCNMVAINQQGLGSNVSFRSGCLGLIAGGILKKLCMSRKNYFVCIKEKENCESLLCVCVCVCRRAAHECVE